MSYNPLGYLYKNHPNQNERKPKMTTITAFDYKATEAISALAKGFVEAVKNDEADTAAYLYQVLYARVLRSQTGGFWRPEGHPHSDGTLMVDQDIHYIIGLAIREARTN